jgi:hypothetical protein
MSFELGEKRYFPGSVLVALIPETKDDARERIRKKLSDLNLGKVGGFTGDDWFLFTPTKKFVTHDFVQNVLAALYEANAMTESDVKFAASGFGIDSPRVSTRPGISSGENVDIDRVRRLSSTLYAVGKVFRDEMRENGLSRTPGGRQCKVVITSNVFLLDFNRLNLL